MVNKVVIRRHGKDERYLYYTGYCLRCHDQITSTGRQRNSSWETKVSAIKNAKLHADSHRAADEREFWNGWDIVGEVV